MDRRDALEEIAAQARRGELVFPTSVTAALRIRQALDAPNCTLDAAARLIETEPLLSARVVALANCAAFNRTGQPITGVRNAVLRLGFRTVHTVAHALIARQLAGEPKLPLHRDLAAQLWQHTTLVSALARVIARRVTHQDPDTALFAALIHEVRGFYLISRADEFPEVVSGNVREDDEPLEIEIGHAVLDQLAVPEPVRAAIATVWEGYLAIPPATLGDTVLLAKRTAPVGSPLFEPRGLDEGAFAAAIELQIEDGTLTEILEASADEIDSLSDALRF
jgi:HD-like signal output (HDOD) protein